MIPQVDKTEEDFRVNKFENNPFKEDVVIIPRHKKVSGIDPNHILVEVSSGTQHNVKFNYNVAKDDQAFIKIYKENIKQVFDLSTSAGKIFWYACTQLHPNNDIVNINRDEFLNWAEYKNRKSYYDGINELLDKKILAQSEREEWYFVNHAVFFNGNRMKVETVYYKLNT